MLQNNLPDTHSARIFGLITGTAIGGLIHILLVIAIILILVDIISGRKRI